MESAGNIDISSLKRGFREIIQSSRIRALTKDEIVYLLTTTDPDEINALYSEANVIRKTYLKEFICVHGIIEFSNSCTKDCCYCGLRNQNISL